MKNSFMEICKKAKIYVFIVLIAICILLSILLDTQGLKSVVISPIILAVNNPEFILTENKNFDISVTSLNNASIDLVDIGISSILKQNNYTSIINSLKDLNKLSNTTIIKENISFFTIPKNAYFISYDDLASFAWKKTYQHYFSNKVYVVLNFGIIFNGDIIHLSITNNGILIPKYSQTIYTYHISD